MSLSRRDSWLGVYEYSNTGTEGVPVDTWTLASTWWGRIDDVRGNQRMVAGAPNVQVDAVIQFADEAVVPANCVVVDGGALVAASAYHVRSVVPRQMHGVQLVYAERLDRNQINAAAFLLNGLYILDGSQFLAGVVTP